MWLTKISNTNTSFRNYHPILMITFNVIYSLIANSSMIYLIRKIMWPAKRWDDEVTDNLKFLHNCMVFFTYFFVLVITSSVIFYYLIPRYALSISFNKLSRLLATSLISSTETTHLFIFINISLIEFIISTWFSSIDDS